MANANRVNNAAQSEKPFRVQAKVRLAELDMTIVELARRLGLARNTVSLAIHKDMLKPTQDKIREELGL